MSFRRWSRRRALAWLAAGTATSTAAGGLGLASATGALAQGRPQIEVDLNLALAVDASGSVNQVRFELQRQGYATAFANPRVLQAIRSGPRAAIAVGMYQWTGPTLIAPVIPWRVVNDETSVRALAQSIAAAQRQLYGGGTSISGAIDFGVQYLGRSPYPATRRVIDVSGDGSNNRGRSVVLARDEAVAGGININGLSILELEPDLEEYFRSNVIGGPGAFVVSAQSFQDFGNAILRKLILEIATGRVPAAPV